MTFYYKCCANIRVNLILYSSFNILDSSWRAQWPCDQLSIEYLIGVFLNIHDYYNVTLSNYYR